MIKKVFQEFYDLETQTNKMTMLTVYQGGEKVWARTAPFWNAYKYYKLGRVTVKMVPASTLPVDPTGLSYEAGENSVDPRDLLTPGLVRITNGEDIDVSAIKNAEGNEAHAIYQNMVLSTHWYKFNLQKGVTKWASPRFWVIGQFKQDYYPGATMNVPGYTYNPDKGSYEFTTTDAFQFGGGVERADVEQDDGRIVIQTGFSSGRGLFQTGEKHRLGWLPTDALIHVGFRNTSFNEEFPAVNQIPVIELFRIILPPAYKTKFYYRCFVTYTIYFKQQVDMPPAWTFPTSTGTETLRKGLPDRFIYDMGTIAKKSTETVLPTLPSRPYMPNDGEADQDK